MRSRFGLLLVFVMASWVAIVAGNEWIEPIQKPGSVSEIPTYTGQLRHELLVALAQDDVAGGVNAVVPDEVAAEEKAVQDLLQGVWIAVRCEQGGKELAQPAVPCIVFEEDRFTIEEGEASLRGQYRINSATDPKQLVMTRAGRGGLAASFGFEEGKLLFCFDPTPNAPAPEKLESVEGDERILVVLAPALVRRFEGHTGPVSSVAFSPDGKLVASGSGWPKGDRTIRLWNASSGKETCRIDIARHITEPGSQGPNEVAGEVRSLAFSADGHQLLVGGAGGFVHLYDVAGGKFVRHFKGYPSTVHGVALSADGRLALAGGRGSGITVWDVKSGNVLRQLKGHRGMIRSVALSPDGRRALSGSFDRTVCLWDMESGKQLRRFETDGWVFGLAFSPDGRRAVAATDTEDTEFPIAPMYVWDLETGKQIHRVDAHRYGMTSAAFSPDGRHILSSGYDWTMRLWDAETGKQLRQFPRHTDWVWSVVFSPDGRFALSAGGGRASAGSMLAGDDFAIRMWDLALATGKETDDEARPTSKD